MADETMVPLEDEDFEEAARLANAEGNTPIIKWNALDMRESPTGRALARMVQQHSKPPVDEAVEVLREALEAIEKRDTTRIIKHGYCFYTDSAYSDDAGPRYGPCAEIARAALTKAPTDPQPRPLWPDASAWSIGTRVRKKRGSEWQGTVCGYYSTKLNPRGYDVENEAVGARHSVQNYAEAQLELADPQP